MKVFLFFGFCLIAFPGYAQEDGLILLKGVLLDPDSVPVDNVYIINIRDLSAYVSRDNGRFNIWVKHGDSLIVNHITFLRKKIYADSVRMYPEIFLEYDTVLIKQVDIGVDPNKLNKYLEKNMDSIRNAKIRIYKRMNPETNLVSQTVTENNIVFRSQAASVSFVSFSPSKVIGMIINDKHKNLKRKGFTFYRNEKQKARKEKKKAGSN